MVIHHKLIALLCICALLAGCAQTESTPTPTPIQRQLLTFLASRLHPGFALTIEPDWSYKVTESGLILANDADLLAVDGGGDMASGSLVADITLLTPAYLVEIGARNGADILHSVVGAPADGAGGPLYSRTELIDIKGRDSAQLLANIAANDTLLLAMALEDHYLLAVIVAPEGEIPTQADALNKVLASAELRLAK